MTIDWNLLLKKKNIELRRFSALKINAVAGSLKFQMTWTEYQATEQKMHHLTPVGQWSTERVPKTR